MLVIPDRKLNVYFDVDDTLVEWAHMNSTRAEDPTALRGLQPACSYVWIPIQEHIDELKRLSEEEDATIVVWSQGGSDWAEIVVKALCLEPFVDVCLTKPNIYFDDLHCSDFMHTRRYIGPPHLMT